MIEQTENFIKELNLNLGVERTLLNIVDDITGYYDGIFYIENDIVSKYTRVLPILTYESSELGTTKLMYIVYATTSGNTKKIALNSPFYKTQCTTEPNSIISFEANNAVSMAVERMEDYSDIYFITTNNLSDKVMIVIYRYNPNATNLVMLNEMIDFNNL